MKFICSKSNLLTGVQTVAKAVPSKTTMSILECILIEADNGNIILTANDMELGIETIIKGDVLVSGKIALDAKNETLESVIESQKNLQIREAEKNEVKETKLFWRTHIRKCLL